jgi:hypothetical protein
MTEHTLGTSVQGTMKTEERKYLVVHTTTPTDMGKAVIL